MGKPWDFLQENILISTDTRSCIEGDDSPAVFPWLNKNQFKGTTNGHETDSGSKIIQQILLVLEPELVL